MIIVFFIIPTLFKNAACPPGLVEVALTSSLLVLTSWLCVLLVRVGVEVVGGGCDDDDDDDRGEEREERGLEVEG